MIIFLTCLSARNVLIPILQSGLNGDQKKGRERRTVYLSSLISPEEPEATAQPGIW
jgi:hypothetical protein